jgi:hypothetical protein
LKKSGVLDGQRCNDFLLGWNTDQQVKDRNL